jgi:endonuclease/exonuclease/phosphatase family metal-dependent hydrolase
MKRNLLYLFRCFFAISTLMSSGQLKAQVTLSSSPYTQDFNGLSNGADNTPVSTPVPPTGWVFLETSTNANTLYTPHNGGGNTGDTYSFGATGNAERSFGQVRSGGLISTLGGSFQNNTGSSIGSITITYVGEQWRLGAIGRNDKMDFQYSLDATSLATGTWIDVNELDFVAPISTGTVGPLDGNAAANRTSLTFTISGLNISNTSTFWIRWNDVNASGADDGLAIDDFQLSFTVGDVSAPIFTPTFPKISNYTTTGFDLASSLNEAGKTYYVVIADNAAAPTSAQIKAGQDGSGAVLGSGFFGSFDNASAATSFSTTLNGLAPDTDYDLYVVAEDNVPNLQPTPVKLDTKTNAVGDATPPEFTASYPSITSVAPNSFVLKSNLNSLGKLYFVVLQANATAPTSTQVKEGKDANGELVPTSLAGSSIISSVATEFNSSIEGLTANTAYDVYVVAEDNVPNLQTSPVKLSVTTLKLFTENFDLCDGLASFSSFSVAGDQVWGCTDFGRASTGLRMNGFFGGPVANEDWLISPVMALSADASLSFYSQFSFAGAPLQLKLSTDYSGSSSPATATWTDLNGNFPTVAVDQTSTSLSDWTLSTVDLSAYAGSNVHIAFVYTSTALAGTAARWSLDEVKVSNVVPSYVSVSPTGLSFSSTGTVKNYTLQGFNLASDVSVTAPANFLVSKDNVTFSSSASYTALESATSKTVYVKFDAAVGSIAAYSGSISNASTGVSTKSVSVKGTDKSKTLDIVSYNLEFFGTDVKETNGREFGPLDDALQISNVTTVMQTIGADIYGTQEVSDDNAYNQLISNLPGYAGILSPRWSYSFEPTDPNFPPQKVGFIYNTATVQLISSRVMFEDFYDAILAGAATLPNYPTTTSSFWSSGRLPFMATFDVTLNGATKRIRVITIHAKSGSAAADYSRRKYDVTLLRDSLVANYANDNVILLGDFNDDIDISITADSTSSYKAFVDDVVNFNMLTLPLSQTPGLSTFPSSNSFIDHILCSTELTDEYVSNSAAVEDARTYISNYTNTASDHLPLSARFVTSKINQAITFNELPSKTIGDDPFSLSASSNSSLPVTFTTNSNNISINTDQVTLLSAGRATITANQVGNVLFNPAVSVDQSFCINPAKPTITITNQDTGTPTLTSSASTGNQWYVDGVAISGATDVSFTATESGVYKVQATIDDCISEFSNDASLIVTDAFNGFNTMHTLHPNPVSDELVVTGLEQHATELPLTDMVGKPINLRLQKSEGGHKANVQHLQEGLYIARVIVNGQLYQIKFIKK